MWEPAEEAEQVEMGAVDQRETVALLPNRVHLWSPNA